MRTMPRNYQNLPKNELQGKKIYDTQVTSDPKALLKSDHELDALGSWNPAAQS